ncbi:hypothetical protein NQ314_009955, partial [Rhamnusium bicolor]
YDLTNTEKWEHLLVGEPLKWRKEKPKDLGDEEEALEMADEKHLDMPLSWSMRINIPHDDGMKVTFFKRTCVEEFAPYVADDGLLTKVTRFGDFECTDILSVEEKYENRRDKLNRSVHDYQTNMVTDTFNAGREDRVVKIPSSEDIATRVFEIVDREIHLKYHYGKGNVTASTRTFIKPPLAEMGEGMVFKPELTYGYQAEIGAKPPRQLALFLLAHEMAFPKLDVSLFNKEQNLDYRLGMLEKEEQQRMYKEKEVEEEIDYLAPYLARMGHPSVLSYQKALDCKYNCLNDFKKLLVERANQTEQLQAKQNWYALNHDNLLAEEESLYFEEINEMIANLRTLEIRLNRHKDLSPLR